MSQRSEQLSARSILRVVYIVVASVLAIYLIYRLRTPITWIIIAAFVAAALAAPTRIVERGVKRRGLAIALVYLGVILVPVGFGAILVPPIVKEMNQLVQQLPGYASDVQDYVNRNETLNKLQDDYDLTGQLREQAGKLPSRLGSAAGVLSDIGLGIVNSVFALVTILILSIFMLSGGKGWIDAFIGSRPPEHQEHLQRGSHDVSAAVAGYVAGATGQAVVAGFSSWIVLTILGVPYAAALGLLIALVDLVPLVGATLGAILVGIVTLFNDFPTDTIVWAVWAIVYQQIENSVIQPRIQSKTVDVMPIIVLIAVLFGSALFGILGALLAIPAAATIQIVYREFRRYRQAIRSQRIVTTDTPPPEEPGTLLVPGA